MAQRIVDVLEIIQIQEQYPYDALLAMGAGDGLLRAVHELGPIRQPRKHVVIGQILQAVLDLLALGDIDHRAEQHRNVLEPLDRAEDLDLDGAAVGPQPMEGVVYGPAARQAFLHLLREQLALVRHDQIGESLLLEKLIAPVTEHLGEARIDVGEGLVLEGIDPDRGTLGQGAIPRLRGAQPFLLDLERRAQQVGASQQPLQQTLAGHHPQETLLPIDHGDRLGAFLLHAALEVGQRQVLGHGRRGLARQHVGHDPRGVLDELALGKQAEEPGPVHLVGEHDVDLPGPSQGLAHRRLGGDPNDCLGEGVARH